MTGMIKTNNKVQACSEFIVPFPDEITKIDCGTAYRHQFKDEIAKHEPIPTMEVGSECSTKNYAESLYFSYAKLKGFGVRKDVKCIDRNG
ncbi:hypothetical protein WN944_010353 [Citrus x changshan-huyou]|uniref:Uncharacterized protein n=1 Tax=Citrus x changshan-huyou TaxID=2935761 RepID=A0AAP0QX15_9ROSI